MSPNELPPSEKLPPELSLFERLCHELPPASAGGFKYFKKHFRL
jgi:hypothetical protein